MRTRTAKKLAQRIDLHYFKRAHPLRRWRTILSIAAPAVALLWLGGMAAAGSRAPYSSGPVSSAHAFAEMKCEVCHVRDVSFRAHVGDKACVTCHDAPVHASNQTTPPDCASCHREHQGRVRLAATSDEFCVRCHADLKTTHGEPKIVRNAGVFPGDHPEFAASRAGASDPGRLKFNHQVHAKEGIPGPKGPETLECATCHKPEIARVAAKRKPAPSGLMAPVNYEQQCARCHPLFFDEWIDAPAPHEKPEVVRAFVQQALRDHITKNPGDMTKPDGPSRRIPLNFPRPPEPPARTPAEWVERRTVRAERLLWEKSCRECHDPGAPAQGQLPVIPPVNLKAAWMPNATFSHAPHLMLECIACHAADRSRATADVLMPQMATCATCHAPAKGAESRCFECHAYHDWSKGQAVKPHFKLSDFSQ